MSTIITGIDFGTSTVKVVAVEVREDSPQPIVIGTGIHKSKGIKDGYIVSIPEAIESLRVAIAHTEAEIGMPIRNAYVGISGIGLSDVSIRVEVRIQKGVVSESDIDAAIRFAVDKNSTLFQNKKIIHEIPSHFAVDSIPTLGSPVGLSGETLTCTVLCMCILEKHYDDLMQVVEGTGIRVQDTIASPLAASLVGITKTQKSAGCILVNIGSDTTSLIIYEDDVPLAIHILPEGSVAITHDIALSLKVSLDEAERLKRGSSLYATDFKTKVHSIASKRIKSITTSITSFARSLGEEHIFPAGILIVGGGSLLTSIEDMVRTSSKLPVTLPRLQVLGKKYLDPTYTVAYGIALYGVGKETHTHGFKTVTKSVKKTLGWFTQFLP